MDTTTYSKSGKIKSMAVLSFLLLICFSASAQEKTSQMETSSVFSNPLFIAMLSTVILLLIVIIVFANVVKAAAHHKGEQEKAKRNLSGTIIKTVLMLIMLGGFSNSLFAQAETAPVTVLASSSYRELVLLFTLCLPSLRLRLLSSGCCIISQWIYWA
jgi:hypothetical protein